MITVFTPHVILYQTTCYESQELGQKEFLNVQCPSVLLLTFELNLIILHCSKYGNKKSDNQMLRCREVYSKLIRRLFAGPIRAYDHMNCFLQNDLKQTIDDQYAGGYIQALCLIYTGTKPHIQVLCLCYKYTGTMPTN